MNVAPKFNEWLTTQGHFQKGPPYSIAASSLWDLLHLLINTLTDVINDDICAVTARDAAGPGDNVYPKPGAVGEFIDLMKTAGLPWKSVANKFSTDPHKLSESTLRCIGTSTCDVHPQKLCFFTGRHLRKYADATHKFDDILLKGLVGADMDMRGLRTLACRLMLKYLVAMAAIGKASTMTRSGVATLKTIGADYFAVLCLFSVGNHRTKPVGLKELALAWFFGWELEKRLEIYEYADVHGTKQDPEKAEKKVSNFSQTESFESHHAQTDSRLRTMTNLHKDCWVQHANNECIRIFIGLSKCPMDFAKWVARQKNIAYTCGGGGEGACSSCPRKFSDEVRAVAAGELLPATDHEANVLGFKEPICAYCLEKWALHRKVVVPRALTGKYAAIHKASVKVVHAAYEDAFGAPIINLAAALANSKLDAKPDAEDETDAVAPEETTDTFQSEPTDHFKELVADSVADALRDHVIEAKAADAAVTEVAEAAATTFEGGDAGFDL